MPPRATLPPLSIAWLRRPRRWRPDGLDAGLAEGVHGAVAVDVEDGGQRDARHPEQLGGEARAHLSGADEADAQRPTGLVEPLLEPCRGSSWVLLLGLMCGDG